MSYLRSKFDKKSKCIDNPMDEEEIAKRCVKTGVDLEEPQADAGSLFVVSGSRSAVRRAKERI